MGGSMASKDDLSKTRLAFYYSEIICKKVDMSSDAWDKYATYIFRKNRGSAEFVYEMIIKPLNLQIKYLASKASCLFSYTK